MLIYRKSAIFSQFVYRPKKDSGHKQKIRITTDWKSLIETLIVLHMRVSIRLFQSVDIKISWTECLNKNLLTFICLNSWFIKEVCTNKNLSKIIKCDQKKLIRKMQLLRWWRRRRISIHSNDIEIAVCFYKFKFCIISRKPGLPYY